MKNILLLSLLFLTLTNCNDADDKPIVNCSTTPCTENFVTLIVSVQDNSGVAIPLDSFEVLDKETGEETSISLSDSEFRFSQLTGEYPLINDSFANGNQNTNKTLLFKGKINEQIVAEAEFAVAIDCCHVSLVSGDAIIIVN